MTVVSTFAEEQMGATGLRFEQTVQSRLATALAVSSALDSLRVRGPVVDRGLWRVEGEAVSKDLAGRRETLMEPLLELKALVAVAVAAAFDCPMWVVGYLDRMAFEIA